MKRNSPIPHPPTPARRGPAALTSIQEAADGVALQDVGVFGDAVGIGHRVEQIHHVLRRLFDVGGGGRGVLHAEHLQQLLESLSPAALRGGRPCQGQQQQQHRAQHGSAVPAPARLPLCNPRAAFISGWKDGLESNMHMGDREGKES